MGKKEDTGTGKCNVKGTFAFKFRSVVNLLLTGKNKNALNKFKAFLWFH